VRVGLYLGDLRRSSTDSHGIINYAVGLATALAESVPIESYLALVVGDEIRDELPPQFPERVELVTLPSPATMAARLRMDHFTIRRLAQRLRLDVLHFPKGHIPVRGINSLKTVATVHDDIAIQYAEQRDPQTNFRTSLKRSYFSWATKHALRAADQVLTVSEFSARALVQHVPAAAEHIAVLPNGISLPLLTPRPQSSKDQTLVHLGSVLPHKQTHDAVVWVRCFLEHHPEFRLVVTGRVSDEVEALCRHPQIRRRREVLTNVEVAELLRDASALVFTSSMEGFGLPPVEALALGTPVVWARAGALPEVMGVAPGGFESGVPSSFQLALEEALQLKDDEVAALADAFRLHYSWGRVAERTWEAYSSLSAPARNYANASRIP
jgi:glycosyltransferase involved in cell wall biosynthesis